MAADHLPAERSHRPGCGAPVRRSTRTRWRALVLVLVHVAVIVHIAHWKIAGTTLTPVEPSEAGETLTLGYVNAGFLLLVLLILSTLVLGRFFCGWACHVVALQDLCAKLLERLGIRPRPVRSRLLVFVPVFAALEMFVLPTLLRLADGVGLPTPSLHLTTSELWRTFPGPGMATLTLFVDGFLVVWLFGAKGFCTYGCPYGAIFGLSDRAAPGRIRVTDACEGCGHCTATCTSNVRVHAEVARYGVVVDPGCMKCMDCVSVCPKDALYFGFTRKTDKERPSKRLRKTYDFTWPEEILMAVVFAAAFLSFRGLYGAVNFMLALGLSVIASIAAITLWRLVRRKSFVFQHLALKTDGRWTSSGFAAVALLPAYLAFTLHSGLVRHHAREADGMLHRVTELPQGPERVEALARSIEHLRFADRWGLVESAALHRRLGQALAEAGELADATDHLRAAVALEPDAVGVRMALAEILLASSREPSAIAEATRQLDEVLAREPEHAPALVRRADLHLLDGRLDRANEALLRALRADPGETGAIRRIARGYLKAEAELEPELRALAAEGGVEAVRAVLAEVLTLRPGHPGAVALRDELR